MSHHSTTLRRTSITQLQAMKGKEKMVALTAYSAPMAELLDMHCDLLLVGDSLGMVLYGMENTLPVTLEMMAQHAHAVVSHSQRALILVDMPFGSYQQSPENAFANAAELLQKSGAQAVKIEGGMEMVDTVRFMVERGIPVMAHIGLKPQHVHAMGGYKVQGRDDKTAANLICQAEAFEQAGAFSLLLEGVEASVAATITQAITIPTIGIGASPLCDGQVLVSEDMLGLHVQTPKFVKRYGDMRSLIENAVAGYADDVKSGSFPAQEHCFGLKKLTATTKPAS